MFSRGLFFPENGHTLNPLRLVQTLADMLQAEGGQVLRRKAVSFGLNGTAARHLQCLGGNIEADVFVVAAGLASAEFAQIGKATCRERVCQSGEISGVPL